ncbi:hypothetical protein [Roseiflexus castenholzii]|uniref:hypothetical protein n=1 Tax=Roseiflexus castenholzii TaxID=120962 RepID=UPI002353DAC2
MTAEFVRPMRTIAILAGGGALAAIAITGGGPWTFMLLGIAAVCGMILSFISSWTAFESGASEPAPSLKSRRMLVILIEGGFWLVIASLLTLIALGQTGTAVYNVVLIVGAVLLVPSMRRKQLCSVTSPEELVGDLIVIVLLTLGFVFLISL